MCDTAAQLARARSLIDTRIGPIKRASREYLSEPWGVTDQPWFRNQAICVYTTIEPLTLLHQLLDIEAEMGRVRRVKNEPRLIDLDLLLYGDLILNSNELKVPHPRLIYRNFVLIPMLEIAPELKHPISGLSIEEHYWMNEDLLEVLLIE
jgi:2-amino-4-hydroxy-6-hydroxymethyldihydropteridine diphosphokinase